MKNTFLAGFILILAGVISFFYWGGRKEVWFCDEIFSYESANGFEEEWPAVRTGQWMTGRDVEAFFSADSERLSLNEITVRLYNDHVPLYFWLFRMVSFFFFKGSGTIWIGLSMNLVFYLGVLGLGYWTFLRLTGRPWLSGAVMVLTCVTNRLMIEQATVLRMYMMLLLAECLLLLAGMWIQRSAEEGRWSPGSFFYLYAVSVFGLLTHYDFWIFYGVTAAVFCLWLLFTARKKRGKRFALSAEFRNVLAWTGNFILSLLTTIWLFPYCRWNLNRGKGQMALRAVFDFSGEKLEKLIWGYRRLSASVFGENLPWGIGLLIYLGCIAGGMAVLYRKKERKKLTCMGLTVLICQLYQLAVCFTMPAGWEERYLWGEFTLMMLCMAYGFVLVFEAAVSGIRDGKRRRIAGYAAASLLAAGILAGELRVIDRGNGVACLFQQGRDLSVLRENGGIPWIVYGEVPKGYSYFDWIIPERICFLAPADTAGNREAVTGLQGEEALILYTYEERLQEVTDLLETQLGKEVTAEFLMKSTYFSVYQMELR